MHAHSSPQTIRIAVDVQNNTIICGTNGGNVSGCTDDRIVWLSGDPRLKWTLQFFPLGLENDRATPLAQLSAWPFREREPAGGIVPATSEFAGTLRDFDAAGGFKYTITVGNLSLDPIIIVDSKPA